MNGLTRREHRAAGAKKQCSPAQPDVPRDGPVVDELQLLRAQLHAALVENADLREQLALARADVRRWRIAASEEVVAMQAALAKHLHAIASDLSMGRVRP